MPIYHANVGVVSRGQGSSAVAKAAYNAAMKLVEQVYDKVTGIFSHIIHDYSKKKGVVYSEILTPDGCEHLFADREELWNKVQLREVRKNARFARKVTLALPRELTTEENIELLRSFAYEAFTSRGMIADCNIHMDNLENPHAHIQLTTRNIDYTSSEKGKIAVGFGDKNREWDKVELLKSWRSLWAIYVNNELEVRGVSERISELSFKTRGIELEPTIKEGIGSQILVSDRQAINEQIRTRNAERIKANPELIVDQISINKPVFTKQDIIKNIGKHFNINIEADLDLREERINLGKVDAAEFMRMYEAVMSSERLCIVGKDIFKNELLYSSQNRLNLENRLLSTAKNLAERMDHNLNITSKDIAQLTLKEMAIEGVQAIGKMVEKQLDIDLDIRGKIKLSDAQETSVLETLNGANISMIMGLPGVGKSTVVREIVRQARRAGYRVRGGAVSSAATRNLGEAAPEMRVYNLASLRKNFEGYEAWLTEQEYIKANETREQKKIRIQAWQTEKSKKQLHKLVSKFSTARNNKNKFNTNTSRIKSTVNDSKIKPLTDQDIANIELDLDYYKQAEFDNKRRPLNNKDMIIIDEVSMVSITELSYFMDMAHKSGCKLVLIGDNNQLKSIKMQGASDKVVEIVEPAVLDQVRRQNNSAHRKATEMLSRGELANAIDIYKRHNNIKVSDTLESTYAELTHNYAIKYLAMAGAAEHTDMVSQGRIAVLAFTNNERQKLNLLIRTTLQKSYLLGETVLTHKNSGKTIDIAIGEQLICNSNDRDAEIMNGELLTVREVKNSILICDTIRNGQRGELIVDTKHYRDIDYAYATTIHKAQGRTYDAVYAVLDERMGYELFNVTMTRHGDDVQLYVPQSLIDKTHRIDESEQKSSEESKLKAAIFNTINPKTKISFAIEQKDHRSLEFTDEFKIVSSYIEAKSDVRQIVAAINHERMKTALAEGHELQVWETSQAADYEEALNRRYELASQICAEPEKFNQYINLAKLNMAIIEKDARLAEKAKAAEIEKTLQPFRNRLEVQTLNKYVKTKNEVIALVKKFNIAQSAMATEVRLNNIWDSEHKDTMNSLLKDRRELAVNIMADLAEHKQFIKMMQLDYKMIAKHAGVKDYQTINFGDELSDDSTKTSINYTSPIQAADRANTTGLGIKLHSKYQQIITSDVDKLNSILHKIVEHKQTANTEYVFNAREVAKEILATQHQLSEEILNLEISISKQQEEKLDANNELAAAEYRFESITPFIMARTFVDGTSALANWRKLSGEQGIDKALKLVERDANILGSLREQTASNSIVQAVIGKLQGKLQNFGFSKAEKIIQPTEEAVNYAGNLSTYLRDHDKAEQAIKLIKDYLDNDAWNEKITLAGEELTKASAQKLQDTTIELLKEIVLKQTQINSKNAQADLLAWRDKTVTALDDEQARAQVVEVVEDKTNIASTDTNVVNKATDIVSNKYSYQQAKSGFGKIENKASYKVVYDGPTAHELFHELRYNRIIEFAQEFLPQINYKKIEFIKNGSEIKCGTIHMVIRGRTSGTFHRFSDGTGGGIGKFIELITGISVHNKAEQTKWVANWLGRQSVKRVIRVKDDTVAEVKQQNIISLAVVPENARKPDFSSIEKHFYHKRDTHKIARVFEYKNTQGDKIGYVVRLELKDGSGRKETLPLAWVRDQTTGRQYWRSKKLNEDNGKPVYGAEKLQNKSKTVLIVEGEKAADAASKLLPEYTVISWLGGSGGVDKVKWANYLQDRDVVIWPDCDAPGMKAANVIIEALDGKANVVMVNPYMLKYDGVVHKAVLPEKWDLADSLPNGLTINNIREAIVNAQQTVLELTSDKIANSISVAQQESNSTINNLEYQEVLKLSYELASITKEYPDSTSLISVEIDNIRQSNAVLDNIEDDKVLSEKMITDGMDNKFGKRLIALSYIVKLNGSNNTHDVNVSHSLSERYDLGLKYLNDLSKYDQFKQNTLHQRYKANIEASCEIFDDSVKLESRIQNREIKRSFASKIMIGTYRQAIIDILIYDELTTKVMSRDISQFNKINDEVIEICKQHKAELIDTGFDTKKTHQAYQKLNNTLYERIIANSELSKNLLAEHDKQAVIILKDKQQAQAAADRHHKEQYDTFISRYAKAMSDIVLLQPQTNLEELKQQLHDCSIEQRYDMLADKWSKLFIPYAQNKIYGLQQMKIYTKTIDEMQDILTYERDFALAYHNKHAANKMDIDQLHKIRRKMFGNDIEHIENKYLIEQIKEDTAYLQGQNIDNSQIMSIYRKENSHTELLYRLGQIVEKQLNSEIETDLRELYEQGYIKKGEQTMKNTAEYQQHLEQHHVIARHIGKNSNIQQHLNNVDKQLKIVQQNLQRQQELQQQEAQKQFEMQQNNKHNSRGIGMDR